MKICTVGSAVIIAEAYRWRGKKDQGERGRIKTTAGGGERGRGFGVRQRAKFGVDGKIEE